MKNLLLIVDMQNGFVTEKVQHIVPNIKKLITSFKQKGDSIAFTRFINYRDSSWEKWIKWSRLMEEPEISIIDELSGYADNVFDKVGLYSAFTKEFESFIEANKIETIYICGVATDGCVLKSAVDSFEKKIEPVVIEDACYSHAGKEVHEAGLLLISRFVGKYQLKTTGEVLDDIS